MTINSAQDNSQSGAVGADTPVEAAPAERKPGRLRVARPRDPLVLKAEADDYEAKAAAAEMEQAQRRVAESQARAEAARKAAEQSRLKVEKARAESKAQEEAATAKRAAGAGDEQPTSAERDKALGTVRPVADDEPRPVAVAKRTTDKFLGSLGLLVLRLVLAGVVGVFGYQVLINRPPIEQGLTRLGTPDSVNVWLAIGLGVVLLAAALLLVLGWGTRIAATVLTVIGVVFLAFYRFGAFNPILENQWGIYGDRELLATAAGFLLITTGAGGWAIDHGIRRGRARRKAQRL